MVVYKTALDAYQAALSGEGPGSNIAARKAMREALTILMQKLAAGLELSADGDLVKLAATGFDLKAKPTSSLVYHEGKITTFTCESSAQQAPAAGVMWQR